MADLDARQMIARVVAAVGAITFLAVAGCERSTVTLATRGDSPFGPVASNADEAWPKRGPPPVPLTPDELVRACRATARCAGAEWGDLAPALVQSCADSYAYYAERAIPVNGGHARAEHTVRCVIGTAGDCPAVHACSDSEPERWYGCQEDGCLAWSLKRIECDGRVATVTGRERRYARDCATAFAECDTTSATGCTDRPYTTCPEFSVPDRCDGDIRLGCDGEGQVSYRDCARLGGECVTNNGIGVCVYPSSPECSYGHPNYPDGLATCDGTTLRICVLGRYVEQDAPETCSE